MAQIVLIHGIGHSATREEKLLRDWLGALGEGLRVAGQPAVAARIEANGMATVVHYGPFFLTGRPGAMGADTDIDDLPDDASAIAKELAKEWVHRAAYRAEDERNRRGGKKALADLEDTPVGAEAQGVRSPARSLVGALAKVPYFARPTMAVAEYVINRDLREVSAYLANTDGIRDKAQKLAATQIGADTKVVIGHSLGSVVAYEACHRLGHPLPLLITLGSPLGLDTIVYHKIVPQPPAYPGKVGWWVNAADPDDIVAAEPKLAGRFAAPEGKQLTDHRVDNGWSAHEAAQYLQQPEVVYPVALTLGETESRGATHE